MTGFETVKAFSNEGFELGRYVNIHSLFAHIFLSPCVSFVSFFFVLHRRYSDAILRFQRATRESQSTLVFVNLSQAAV
jgi:hypothetical protein